MPIFEYKCRNCNTVYDILHKSTTNTEDIFCPNCKSKNGEKLISVFAVNNSNSSTSNACSDGSCGIPNYGGCQNGMCGLN